MHGITPGTYRLAATHYFIVYLTYCWDVSGNIAGTQYTRSAGLVRILGIDTLARSDVN